MTAPPFRAMLRRMYRALPLKQPVFEVLRRVWAPPERLYRHLHFEGVFEVAVEPGTTFRLRHRGNQLENELFWEGLGGGWEPGSMEIWLQAARTAGSIWDVGANSGAYALGARAVNPGATVVALEPVARLFRRLEDNRALNAFDLHLFQAAASDRDGTAVLEDPGGEGALSAKLRLDGPDAPDGPSSGKPDHVTVATRRLDTLQEKEGLPPPDLLKIDVEGHEARVLRGMGRLLTEHQPAMLLEVLDDRAAERLAPLLAGLDYVVYDVDEEHPPRRIPGVRPSSRWNLFLCSQSVAAALGLDMEG